jgi:hypothetical protein
MGQQNAVTIFRLHAENTLDTSIFELVDGKRTVVNRVLGGDRVPESAARSCKANESLADALATRLLRQALQRKGQPKPITAKDVLTYLRSHHARSRS